MTFPDYRGRPLFDTYPNWKEEPDSGLIDDFSYDSQTGGAAIPWMTATGPKRTLTLHFLFDSLHEIKLVRSFIAERDGRRKGFWVPTWLTDFVPVANVAAGNTMIVVRYTGLASKVAFAAQFRFLSIITRTKIECYRITSSTVGSDIETLVLDRGLDTDLDASSSVVCGLLYARLGDDKIAYEYLSGNVVRLALKFTELPREADGTAHNGTRPLYLYRITRGLLQWRFTNWPVSVVIGGDTWAAGDIEQSEITQSVDFDMDPITLSISTDDPAHPIRRLLNPNIIRCTEIEIFESDADTLAVDFTAPVYLGRLGPIQFGAKGTLEAHISSIMRVGEREIPQGKIGRTCIHSTYDSGCTLDPALFTTAGTISGISAGNPPWVEAAAFGARATAESDPNWFALGRVVSGGEERLCTGQDGNRLYLDAPFDAVIIGDPISALAGDDMRVDTCALKFGNVANHLALPYMPNKSSQYEALATPTKTGGKK